MKKNKTFCIGDIHGSHKALVQVLEKSDFDYGNDTLITIGDIVDGWGDSYMVVEELLLIKNRIDIMGNHDDWFVTFIETSTNPDGWSQGGLATAKSYATAAGFDLKYQGISTDDWGGKKTKYTTNLIPEDIPKTHQQFFKKQHRYYVDKNKNVFVHGGFDRAIPIGRTPFYEMMWNRKLWNQALSAKSGKSNLKFYDDINKVFIGHTTTMAWGSMEPMKASNVWNLDTGAGGNGKLSIMNVDTEEYWQSDLVEKMGR